MTAFRHPDFLSEDDEPRQRVRCPVHGFIRYSENERQIIDHPLFQRLRLIRQLALTELVYPGATHTRFEHSLGVMEVATRMFDALAATNGAKMEHTFSLVAGLEDRPLAKCRQYLRLAALLHDVGHTCFSHAAEEVISAGEGHEALSLRIVRNEELLGEELTRRFGRECPERVAQLIEGGSGGLPPQLQLLKDLISGQMDADRIDYLRRDSHHCGVDYGRFDYERLIESLELHEDSSGELLVAINRGGLHSFEGLILARYQMNTQVYYHRLRRVYDYYLRQYFRSLDPDVLDDQKKILAANDFTMLTRILRDAERGEPERQRIARGIRDRDHHRVVFETTDHANAYEVAHTRSVAVVLRDRYSDRDVFDDLAGGDNHKLLLPTDDSETGRVRLFLVGSRGARHVGEESLVLSRIPRRFQCARVFAALGRNERHIQDEMEAMAQAVKR